MTDISPLTRGIRAGLNTDTGQGAVVPPIYLSTNYAFAGFDQPRDYDYSRCGNPNRDALAEAVATLEGGAGAVVTPTGLAAITLVLLRSLRPGDHVVIPHDCYGGSWRLFQTLAAKGHFTVDVVDQTDDAALDAALARRPAMVWVETPSNPLLRITDVASVAARAKAAGALVVADNTFLTPLLQQPIALGCDIVVHSTTKYLNGHSDVVGGVVVAKDADVAQELADWANNLGLVGSPFDAYLTLRGVRTLHTRMRQHEENAAAVVEAIADHPAVAKVYWPGLPEHPGHELAARQQKGFGAMMSLDLVGGVEAVKAAVDGLQVFTFAESLGGTESLLCHPPTMTHASMTPEALREAGIGEGLLRLSIGIEHAEDLVRDLRAALDRALEAAEPA